MCRVRVFAGFRFHAINVKVGNIFFMLRSTGKIFDFHYILNSTVCRMLWPNLVQTAFLQPIHSEVDTRRCWAEEMVLAVS